jgi:hypothetical protein
MCLDVKLTQGAPDVKASGKHDDIYVRYHGAVFCLKACAISANLCAAAKGAQQAAWSVSGV